MFTTKDGEKRYLDNWGYNSALILAELRKIIVNNGGTVKPVHTAIIENRALGEGRKETEYRLAHLKEIENEMPGNNEKRKEAIKEYSAKIEKYSTVDNTPVEIPYASWITFTLDNAYYNISLDDNPFFPFYLQKTPIVNGEYSCDACGEEFTKDWLWDCFFTPFASTDDRKEAANLMFNAMQTARNSAIMRDKRRVRVSNKYDGGYHYETIYGKERRAKIDF